MSDGNACVVESRIVFHCTRIASFNCEYRDMGNDGNHCAHLVDYDVCGCEAARINAAVVYSRDTNPRRGGI